MIDKTVWAVAFFLIGVPVGAYVGWLYIRFCLRASPALRGFLRSALDQADRRSKGPDLWVEEGVYSGMRAAQRDTPHHLDGTPGAHPAWWRGVDRGTKATADILRGVAEGVPRLDEFADRNVEEAAQAIERLLKKESD